METVDVLIPEYILQVFMNCFHVASIFILCAATNAWFLVLLALVAYCFQLIYSAFRAASRDLKRLESISRSPVYASFSETLVGLDTIRAFGAIERFKLQHRGIMDTNQSMFFSLWMSMCWVTIRLEAIGSVVLFAVAIFAVVLSEQGAVDPVLLGMALVYVIQLTALFQRCVQVLIDTETYMTSAERMFEYTEIEGEAPSTLESDPSQWPSKGSVEFSGVVMRYRDGPEVLRRASFQIRGGQRVGVCGRTGAGKSSLIAALFRVVEIEEGAITIDGIDISTLGLRTLRSNLSIIPQDSVIFGATVRENLDPEGKVADADLHAAIKEVHLGELLERLPMGLSTVLAENGGDLSQGERQLLCFARALVRRTRIIFLDEATSSVDHETDALIQTLLRSSLQDTTVITIAHRLATIADYDQILVMGAGAVLEFGPPAELLQRPDGEFRKMMVDAGQH